MEPKSKMRKLNVSFNGAGDTHTQSNDPKPSTSALVKPSTSKASVTNDKPNPTSSIASTNRKPDIPQPSHVTNDQPPKDDLWGDADDEFILIASQMVDNMDLDAINQQIIMQATNMSQGNVVEEKIPNEAQNVLQNFFNATEEDDRLFSEMHNFDDIGNTEMNDVQKTPYPNNDPDVRPTSPSVFKVPTGRYVKPVQSSTQIDMNLSFQPESHPQSTQFRQQIEIPKPVQPTGKFLDRLFHDGNKTKIFNPQIVRKELKI